MVMAFIRAVEVVKRYWILGNLRTGFQKWIQYVVWVILFEKETCFVVVIQSLSHVRLFATSWTVAHQVPLSMELLRQEYWSRLPFPSPGHLPRSGIELPSLALAGRFLTTEPPGKPQKHVWEKVNEVLSLRCAVFELLTRHHFMANRWETMETVIDFVFLGSKTTAAMKLKDTCSLQEKLWPTQTAN